MRIVPGPDFPTAGLIYGRAGIESAYRTGRGTIVMRARMSVEKSQGRGEREQIVVTEIPYQVNKARTRGAHRGAGARQEDRGHQRGARRERSRRHPPGHRAQEGRHPAGRHQPPLPADRSADVLRRHQPRHRTRAARPSSTSRRRSRPSSPTGATSSRAARATSCARPRRQREIVEGLGVAVTDVDLVVKTIRASADPDVARRPSWRCRSPGLEAFVRRAGRPRGARSTSAKKSSPYTLTERQAKAILEMRLSRLTGLEQEKLAKEYAELCDAIARYRAILAEPEAARRRHRHGARGDPARSTPTSAAPRSSRTRPRSRTRTSSRKRTWSSRSRTPATSSARAPRTTGRRSAAARAASAWRPARRTG